MTEHRGSAEGATENGKPGNDLPIGAAVRVSKLSTLTCVRAELGRLYREARRREGRYPDALTAQRLANVLGHVRTMIEVELIEQRLAVIEERMNARP